MKICMITSMFFPTIGGIETHVYHLSKQLIKLGHKVVIIHTIMEKSKNGNAVKVENYDGLEVHRFYMLNDKTKTKSYNKYTNDSKLSFFMGFLKKARPNLYSKKIAEYILSLNKMEPIDIIHQHDFIGNISTTKRLSKQLPVIITNHTGEFLMLNNNKFLRLSLRILLSHYRHLIGPSKELININFLKKSERVTYIPNGVSLDDFTVLDRVEKNRLRQELGYDEEEILILCARRWAPTKGVKYFVEAIPAILKKIGDRKISFLISGNDYVHYPAYKQEIMEFINENKISDSIRLLGDIPHNEIKKYYQISDIVVLPSLMEATSLSGLEAMACGKPLLGTNIGGIPEIIDQNSNGILVEPKDAGAIAEGIIKLVQDDHLESMGKSSRTKVELEFSWGIITQRTLDIYKRCIE
ncbi:glycosyltransferase family 4 protein [Marinicrinis lubricantis]|uniref:Glycosyltransferase family 4 protein n=1 Tax=Marinicrinis lubricantis TaxID=2086470 RepID=A0ABW1IKM2_9BACL